MIWRSLVILHCFIYYVCSETNNYTAAKMTKSYDTDDRKIFAWQVSLRRSNVHYCGGGIINEFHIITSAQCCFSKNFLFRYKIPSTSIVAVAGDLKLHEPLSSTQIRKISCVLPHEKFDKVTLVNDIALMRVKKAWLFTSFVKATGPYLPPQPPSVWFCLTAGWGSRDPAMEKVSENLKWFYGDNCTPKQCKTTHGSAIKPGMFCVGDHIDYGQGPTDADRGSPVVCPTLRLVGVATSPSGFIGRSLYTGVVFHERWIDTAKQRPCPLEMWVIVAICSLLLLVLLGIGIYCLLRYFKIIGGGDDDEEDGDEEGGEEGGEEEGD